MKVLSIYPEDLEALKQQLFDVATVATIEKQDQTFYIDGDKNVWTKIADEVCDEEIAYIGCYVAEQAEFVFVSTFKVYEMDDMSDFVGRVLTYLVEEGDIILYKGGEHLPRHRALRRKLDEMFGLE